MLQIKVGDFAKVKGGKRLPAGDDFAPGKTSHPYIRTRDIQSHQVNVQDVLFINDDTHSKISRYIVDKDDLIISIVGTVGSCAIIPDSLDKANLTENCAKIIPNCEVVDTKYLYYFLTSYYGQNEIRKNTVGSTQLKLPLYGIQNIEVIVHPLMVQKSIAHILATLDNKIELNQKINRNLEDTAKAIFNSWFIDFDPVRLKVEGKPTCLTDEISNLFPSMFVESEIGSIPSGWSIKSLKECNLQVESGRRPKGGIDKTIKIGIPSVGAESIDLTGVFDFSNVKYVTEDFAEKSNKGWVKNYDVALYKDGAYVSKVTIWGDGFPFETFLVNEHIFLLRSPDLGQFFLYRLFSSPLMVNQIVAKGTSKAAQPGLNQEEVLSCTFLCPPKNLIDKFNELVTPLVKKQLILGLENLKLSEIRDALLPKLISGELQVPDAEKFLSEVGM